MASLAVDPRLRGARQAMEVVQSGGEGLRFMASSGFRARGSPEW